MINTSLDLVPPIRGLESFSFSMFYCCVGWMAVFFFRGCQHILFLGLEEGMLSRNFREIVLWVLIDRDEC